MELTTVSLALTDRDEVRVIHSPARTLRLESGWAIEVPERLTVVVGGELHLSGRPAVVVRMLGAALTKCFAEWGRGTRTEPGEADPEPPLPPQPVLTPVGAALSRVAGGDGEAACP